MNCPICNEKIVKLNGNYQHKVEGDCREPYNLEDLQPVFELIEKQQSIIDAAIQLEMFISDNKTIDNEFLEVIRISNGLVERQEALCEKVREWVKEQE